MNFRMKNKSEASSGLEELRGSSSDSAPLWEIRLAWVLRIPILATAALHLYQGTSFASPHWR